MLFYLFLVTEGVFMYEYKSSSMSASSEPTLGVIKRRAAASIFRPSSSASSNNQSLLCIKMPKIFGQALRFLSNSIVGWSGPPPCSPFASVLITIIIIVVITPYINQKMTPLVRLKSFSTLGK